MRRLIFALIVLASLVSTTPATAHEAVPYQERIQVGPYPVDVWVSDWPIAAQRSVDFTFTPEGGIADKSARIRLIQPDGSEYFDIPLPRHPRNRAVWGLDLIALPEPGLWTIELTIDGPAGAGTGTFGPMDLLEQQGPPPGLSWLIGVLPPLLFLGFLVVLAWRRFPVASRRLAWSWQGEQAA
jgi:hypothetical protein